MRNYHYSYFIGAIIFGFAWVVCYVLGKKYRAQIIWGSLVSAPLAFSGFLFIPQYWTPPSLFNLDQRIKISIEDVLWSAAVGGIASVVGEIVLKERLSRIRKQEPKRHYAPFVVMMLVFGVAEFLRPNKTIYNTVAAFVVGALVIAWLRRDLIVPMLSGAVAFTVLYLALFVFLLLLYPDFVNRYYNIPNLLGIYVLGVPVEELMFAAGGGAIWSVAYEYVRGYRLASLAPFRLARVE